MGVRKQTMARHAVPAAVIVAVLLLFAGCTVRRAGDCLSSPAAGKATATAVPAQGVTRRTVTLSMLAVAARLAGQNLHERGFARAIGPGQAIALAWRKHRGNFVEQTLAP